MATTSNTPNPDARVEELGSRRLSSVLRDAYFNKNRSSSIAALATAYGTNEAARLLKIAPSTASYHKNRRIEEFSTGKIVTHGGKRYLLSLFLFSPVNLKKKRWEKMSTEDREALAVLLFSIVENDPKSTVMEYVNALNDLLAEFEYPTISKDDVKKQFRAWKWSWKIPGLDFFSFFLLSFFFNE